jgi:hypothetical protein
MTASQRSYPSIEGEFEDEFEDEFEGEFEDEYESEYEGEFEFEFEAEAEAELEAEGELEDEFEDEYEDEAEGFVNPVRRIYRDAELMAHLSAKAAAVEGEEEAEAFIGALIPLAAKLIPRAAALVTRNAPALIKGANRLSRQLRRNPRTRRLVRTMPVILQRTAQVLADQSDGGEDPSAGDIIGTLGNVARSVLAPSYRGRAMRAVSVFDRRYRRRTAWQRGRRRTGYSRTVYRRRPVRRTMTSRGRRGRRRY